MDLKDEMKKKNPSSFLLRSERMRQAEREWKLPSSETAKLLSLPIEPGHHSACTIWRCPASLQPPLSRWVIKELRSGIPRMQWDIKRKHSIGQLALINTH